MANKKATQPATFVALLRGINVGGKHLLPIKELAEMFAKVNCANVRTYIQSGNVIFNASPAVVDGLAQGVEKKIFDRFGFHAPVILRNFDEMARTVRSSPFLQAGAPEKELHVYFLAEEPSVTAINTLDPDRSAPDAFRVSGREIYLHLPNGAGRSKLTSTYFDSRLATVGTQRNWATVLKILELMKG